LKFVDIAEITVKAGNGGAGMAHFRREKFVPAGGPDGGSGGNGGSIHLKGDEGLSTLLDFRYQRHHTAEDGGKGGTNNRQGARGEDLTLTVPCGTVAYDADTDEPLGEVLSDGETLLVAQGGRGGIGNAVFTSSTQQAPTQVVPPGVGDEKHLRLELKLIADVAIIGAPNAGKSTLIRVISAARPKVADYPFTTLVPNLGVVQYQDHNPFVVADVPGLIPGASQGKGLGHEFLRHIERTKALVHLIDGSQEDEALWRQDHDMILEELNLYNPELLQRPRLTIISKIDTHNTPEFTRKLKDFEQYLVGQGLNPPLGISAASRVGIDKLLESIVALLNKEGAGEQHA
jgi:GTP-binding protein